MYASTKDKKLSNFWVWIFLPLASTAMAISIMLKPRREDFWYKIFLMTQYILFAFVSEVLALIGDDFHVNQAMMGLGRSLVWAALFSGGMKIRSQAASLCEAELSDFLTNHVIKGGVFIGLGQLTFLMFASIQCDGNADDWQDCSRTLYSQTGLSLMVSLYLVTNLVSGVVPKRIIERHFLTFKQVIAMEMGKVEVSRLRRELLNVSYLTKPLPLHSS